MMCVTSQKWPMWFLPHDLYLPEGGRSKIHTVTGGPLKMVALFLDWNDCFPYLEKYGYNTVAWVLREAMLYLLTQVTPVFSVTQSCLILCNPWTVACLEALRSMGCTNNLYSMKLFYERSRCRFYPGNFFCVDSFYHRLVYGNDFTHPFWEKDVPDTVKPKPGTVRIYSLVYPIQKHLLKTHCEPSVPIGLTWKQSLRQGCGCRCFPF